MADLNHAEEDIMARHRFWFRRYQGWRVLQWTLAILIAGGSAFVASSVSEEPIQEWIALLVALSSALQLALRPERMASAYREAWIAVDLTAKELAGVRPELIEALRKAENRIGDTHVTAGPGGS